MKTTRMYKSGNSAAITIPRFIRSQLKLAVGDVLAMEIAGDALVLREIKAFARLQDRSAAGPAAGRDAGRGGKA